VPSRVDTRRTRAACFASTVGGCKAHQRAARSVLAALERLMNRPLRSLDPEASIQELLLVEAWPSRTTPTTQPRVRDMVADALRNHLEVRAQDTLLGPVAQLSTWSFEALLARSVRGVVNERVRLLGTCTCVLK
jgi:hypothetical protein